MEAREKEKQMHGLVYQLCRLLLCTDPGQGKLVSNESCWEVETGEGVSR